MEIQSLLTEDLSNIDKINEISLNHQLVSVYGLEEWGKHFSLMTAGYRDHIDPEDAANPKVPFNVVTVAIMTEAKARVLCRKIENGHPKDIHVGGEVRAHTQTFIKIAARIYAAHGFRVHLRQGVPTSPIWYSSFGVFYEEYQSGDNFTASHSPYFKLGWKVLDNEGKELTEEEEEIIHEVRYLISQRATIRLAPGDSNESIRRDFNVDEEYTNYQRSVLGSEVLNTIHDAAEAGFRCAASPLGGSMGSTSRRVFHHFGIPGHTISYFLDSEDPRFHYVGEINNHNYGADVGKSEVCANTGAPAKLLAGEADLVLLWDPDGDRLNVMTTSPSTFRKTAEEVGLNIGPSDENRMIVYLTPNQLYLLLVEYRINLLRAAGLLQKYDWFVGTTFPTATAIEELAAQEGLSTVRVPVGFRNLGDLCRAVENNLGTEQTFITLTGQRIPLGPQPRALILCEESGGATLGGPELMRSKKNQKRILALREKDGMQLAVLAWSMGAALHKSGRSMAEEYCDIIYRRNIQYRYSIRLDISLYNESLTGTALQAAKMSGILQRDRIVAFFRRATVEFSNNEQPESEIRDQLEKASSGSGRLPFIVRATWVGDGSMFEMEGARLVIRASGTDALIRYYLEATSPENLNTLRRFVAGLNL